MQVRSSPTRLFAIFKLAEKNNMTVGELLSGKKFPYSNLEFMLQLVYSKACLRLQQESK